VSPNIHCLLNPSIAHWRSVTRFSDAIGGRGRWGWRSPGKSEPWLETLSSDGKDFPAFAPPQRSPPLLDRTNPPIQYAIARLAGGKGDGCSTPLGMLRDDLMAIRLPRVLHIAVRTHLFNGWRHRSAFRISDWRHQSRYHLIPGTVEVVYSSSPSSSSAKGDSIALRRSVVSRSNDAIGGRGR
jgi:hypothetical protein